MHFKAYQKYKRTSLRLTLPIIVISTITGTANFAQETFPPHWKKLAPVVIGGLNLFGGILTTVLQFLKINELMESHRVSSILYGKLSRTIRLQLTLPIFERSQESSEFVENCGNEYDRLIEQSPSIPSKIIQNFEHEHPSETSSRSFMNKLKMTNDSKFIKIIKPEIIDITPISPYSGEEELKRIKEVVEVFKKPIRRPPSPSQKNRILRELKSLSNRSLVASKVNKIVGDSPESPPIVEKTQSEVIDDLLEEVVVDVVVEKPTNSVKNIAASFDKSGSS